MSSACREILKRAALIAGAINSAPLKSASFGTFLAETRKVQRINQCDKLKLRLSVLISRNNKGTKKKPVILSKAKPRRRIYA